MKKLIFALVLFAGFSFVSAQNLGDLSFSFCDGKKNVTLDATEGSSTDLCFVLKNNSAQTGMISIGFVDGSYSDQGNNACKNEGEITKFGQFITIDQQKPGERIEIPVPPKTELQKNAVLSFPKGYGGGLVNGCITYYIKRPIDQKAGNVTVLVRRANFIDVILSGELKNKIELLDFTSDEANGKFNNTITGFSKNNKIRLYKDIFNNNQYMSEVLLKNDGSMSNEYIVNFKLSDIFGIERNYKKPLKISGGDYFLNSEFLKDMPWYNGWFKLKVQLAYRPISKFNITGDVVKQLSGYIEESVSFFVFPWKPLFILIGILALVGLIVYMKKKKIKIVLFKVHKG